MHRFEPPPLPGSDRPAPEPTDPWARPPQGYAVAPRAPWGAPASPVHPRGTTVLVLGILSVVVAPVLGPFAWAMGRTALREADAAPAPVSNRSSLQAGMALGVIGTALLVMTVLAVVLVVLVGIAGVAAA
ncbi:hypothetical protein [Ornithinimicrobium pekingense]|uniref:DUF4190 domain-containing protein n=1 Tax=Ornithinimicrobium pekingense TaxID=384677 RepID=A0ABQ2FAP8_9MICO|nr:hypothetical protein [Ornithinimicrobium pekingense]GGK78214.1 hypothetical protein GCM10011509_28460 [Ornithinimicrobium pekingense]